MGPFCCSRTCPSTIYWVLSRVESALRSLRTPGLVKAKRQRKGGTPGCFHEHPEGVCVRLLGSKANLGVNGSVVSASVCGASSRASGVSWG